MAQIILDLGGGDNTRNSTKYVKEMIDSIKAIDTGKHKIILKFQLFKKIRGLTALHAMVFYDAYNYGRENGYQVTASVFDKDKLSFLEIYHVPFIKIACRVEKYYLIYNIIQPIYISIPNPVWINNLVAMYPNKMMRFLCCVPKYPASITEYQSMFYGNLSAAVSDHTVGLELFRKYQPLIWEKHFVLKHGETADPYGDDFCVTPDELKEIL